MQKNVGAGIDIGIDNGNNIHMFYETCLLLTVDVSIIQGVATCLQSTTEVTKAMLH